MSIFSPVDNFINSEIFLCFVKEAGKNMYG